MEKLSARPFSTTQKIPAIRLGGMCGIMDSSRPIRFGVHDFEKKPAGNGRSDHPPPARESLTFRYRFYLHEGDELKAKVAEMYDEYAPPPTTPTPPKINIKTKHNQQSNPPHPHTPPPPPIHASALAETLNKSSAVFVHNTSCL